MLLSLFFGCQVAKALGFNANAMSTYQGKKRDKFTGETHTVTVRVLAELIDYATATATPA